MTADTLQNVAIIGGGLGGLTLARILQVHGAHPVVYERDAGRDENELEGALDMYPESGQHALREAGLYPVFRAIVRIEGQDLRILDKNGTMLWEEIVPPYAMDRPEVDRNALRDMLIDSLFPAVIRWGHELTHVTPGPGGAHTLHFEHGDTAVADLVVGADGASSRVRALVSDAKPHYTGVSFVEIGLSDADRLHPAIAKQVGRGSLFALGDDKGLIAQRQGDGRIRVYVALRVPQTWVASMPHQAADARAMLLKQFADWAPQLTDVIRRCDDTLLPHALNMLPVDHRWDPHAGVTLIGDAAHLMSPFAGEGANLAMLDAAELAHALLQSTELNTALRTFETAMFARSEAAAQQSAQGLDLCIAAEGAQRFADVMADQVGALPE